MSKEDCKSLEYGQITKMLSNHLWICGESAIPHHADPWPQALELEVDGSYPDHEAKAKITTTTTYNCCTGNIKSMIHQANQRWKAFICMASQHRETTMCAGVRGCQCLAEGVHTWPWKWSRRCSRHLLLTRAILLWLLHRGQTHKWCQFRLFRSRFRWSKSVKAKNITHLRFR